MKPLRPSRRGRRSAAEEHGILEPLQADPLPPIGGDILSVKNALAELWRRVGAGEVDRATCEALTRVARVAVTAERAYREQNELREMEAMLQEMRNLDAAAEGRADDVRQGRRPSR